MTVAPTVTDERRSDALLVLRGAAHLPVGRGRSAMLEAIAADGSITASAKALGYSPSINGADRQGVGPGLCSI